MKRAIGILLLMAVPSFGAEFTRTIRDVTPILDGEGAARVLFKLDAPIDASNVAVRSAKLTFRALGVPQERRLNLRLHPVTTAWTPGAVDWNTGWSRPGGDFDDARHSRAEIDLREASSELTIDCTAVFKEIVEGGVFADGFILTVDPSEGNGIRTADLARLQGLATATLDVKYRKIPPSPVQRGR
jgi:hypothetical protein